MIDTDSAAEVLMAAGLPSRPPHVLVTRWLALLADEDHLYLDVAFESGAGVPGTRYVFVAVTEAAVCYLHAEHDDDVWDQPRVSFNRKSESMTPRTLVAWRRPLTLVTEVGLGGRHMALGRHREYRRSASLRAQVRPRRHRDPAAEPTPVASSAGSGSSHSPSDCGVAVGISTTLTTGRYSTRDTWSIA